MIGNDIVDLTLAASGPHWKTQRFLDKVFSAEEQQLIKDAEDNLRAIWLLWSMKESAYKCHIQCNQFHFFAPTKIACQLSSNLNGLVSINNTTYYTFTQITKNFIHTISYSSASSEVLSDFGRLEDVSYKIQHNESRRSVLNVFSSLLNIDIDNLTIKKTETGVPFLYKHNVKQSIPLSITHHGYYYGYALVV